MQNRYVGDIGDYLKLGILRALSPGYRLGVAWWLHPDEEHNEDGRHIGYLRRDKEWRSFDPELFDALDRIVGTGRRSIRALEEANLLPDAVFASEFIPCGGLIRLRQQDRREWFAVVKKCLTNADLVFVDPDNGLEPDGFTTITLKAGKSISFDEMRELAFGRCIIAYHHQTRRKGGHLAEIEHLAARLRRSGFKTVDALRAKPYSPRVFFLLDAPAEIRVRAERIAAHWTGLITWHAAIGGANLAVFPRADHGNTDAVPEQGDIETPVPNGAAYDRMTEPGIFMIGDEVIYDGEAKHFGVKPLTKLSVLPSERSDMGNNR